MAKKLYAADGGRSRKIGKLYAAEDGAAQKIRKLYAVFGGVCRTVYLSAYRWAVYNSVGTTSWNKSEAEATTTYVWKRYKKKTVYGEWRLSLVESTSYEVDYSDAARMKYFSKINVENMKYSDTAGTVSIDKNSFAKNGAKIASYDDAYMNTLGVDEDGNEVFGLALGAYGDRYTDAEEKFDYSIPGEWTYIAVATSIVYDRAADMCIVHEEHYEKTAYRTADTEPDTDGGYTEVTADSPSAYPNNGESGEYWYVYDRKESGYKEGQMIETVSSTNASAYPENGRHTDGYWYRRTGITYSKGDKLVGTAESENVNAYPENGRHKDGLWYVRED